MGTNKICIYLYLFFYLPSEDVLEELECLVVLPLEEDRVGGVGVAHLCLGVHRDIPD